MAHTRRSIFGVPQRRKRVFVIASSSDRFDPAKVLFERPCVCGHSCESAEKRKVTTAYAESSFGTFREDRNAGTLKAKGGTLGGGSETLILDISYRPDGVRVCGDIAPTLLAKWGLVEAMSHAFKRKQQSDGCFPWNANDFKDYLMIGQKSVTEENQANFALIAPVTKQ